ncbi:UvrD-helicase domain-containing protein [Kallipyga gabonensis]|uniref:UvrD-helicase domain-containing protein n=1 Tax=Kallipyga gabonensis TaxID=1686287 RepID=UPI0006B4178D|nr:UvrD-helicase domain-containing protein [Kallipyga gabonensis]
MTQVQFTEEQKKVVEERDRNLLVSAQAGAGKTAVLVERVIREILEDDRSLKNMLIVTFTNKAANSLKEKIREALTGALGADREPPLSPEARYRLFDQVNSLASANIQTLHAFCYEKIQENFDRLGMDPGVHIIEAKALAELKNQAMDELMDTVYTERDPEVMAFIEAYGLSNRRSDDPLRTMVDRLVACMDQVSNPEEWVMDRVNRVGSPDDVEESFQAYKALVVLPLLTAFVKEYEVFLDRAEEELGAVDPGLGRAYVEALEEEPVYYEEAVLAYFSGDPSLIQSPPSFKALTVSKKYGEEAVAIKDRFKKNRDLLRRRKEELLTAVKKADREALAQEGERIKTSLTILVDLALDYKSRLQALKKENRAISFDDMEHLMVRLLDMEDLRKDFQDRYQSIYFDEYQDASDLQNIIIEKLAGDRGRLFFVGDIKQSIYAFRKAQPQNFIDRMEAYEDERDDRSLALFLTYNFRSEKNVLDFINAVFDPLMVPERGEVLYRSPGQRGRVNLPAQERALEDLEKGVLPGQVEVVLLNQEKEEEGEEEAVAGEGEEYINEKPAGAFYLARWIKNYLAESPDHSYRDITVLFRKNIASLNYDYVLRYFGIPTHTDLGSVDMEATELAIALNLLKVIDNAREDLPLLSALSSYVGGWSDDDLASVRIFHPHGSFSEAFFALLDVEEVDGDMDKTGLSYDDLRKQALEFWSRILAFRKAQDLMPLADFVAYVFRSSGFYDYVQAMDHGGERKENLHVLLRYAELYEGEGRSDLTGMIRRLEEETGSGGEGMNPANDLSESDNVVRLMTIHGSKGLDAKVVVLADLAARFHGKLTEPYSFSTEEGLSLADRREDSETGKILEGPSIRLDLDKSRQLDRERDEEVRIFYVALTRAISRLVLIGGGKDLADAFLRPLARNGDEVQFELDQGKSFQDWLITLLRHDRSAWTRARGSIGQDLKNRVIRLPEGSAFSDDHLEDGRPKDGFSLVIEEEGAYRPWDGEVSQPLKNPPPKEGSQQEGIWKRAEEVMSFTYPDSRGRIQPIKKSVTELISQEETSLLSGWRPGEGNTGEGDLLSIPEFLRTTGKIQGADYGSIVHNILQTLPIRPYSPEELKEEIRGLVDRAYLTDEEVAGVDLDQVLAFYHSPLGKRLWAMGPAIHREEAFTLRIKEKDLPPGLRPGEGQYGEGTLTIDGRMDLFVDLEETGEGKTGLLLLDFKTDRVMVKDRYIDQVKLYALALEKALGKPVVEAYLYWVRHRKAERLDLTK